MKHQLPLSAAIWAVSYMAALYLTKADILSGFPALGFALLPIASFAYFIYAWIRNASTLDEVQIRVQLEAVVVAFSLMIMLMMTLGVVGLSVELNMENWGHRHLVPYFFLTYAIGLFIAHRRYSIHHE